MGFVYLFCADGFEEVEGLTVVDLLRRANLDVRTVSIMGRRQVTSSHGIKIETDLLFEEMGENIEKADLIVLPGGMPGTTHLKEHKGLLELLKKQYEEGKWLAAICAAPSVFAGLGFLQGRKATSYPNFVGEEDCGQYLEQAVVIDGNIVTSRGLGTAIPFGLALIALLKDKGAAEQVAASILYI